MLDYVLTVEAKFLQMFILFHIYCNNMEGVISQFNLFNRHFMELSRRFQKVLKIEDSKSEYKYGSRTYKHATALSIGCLNNNPDEVYKLVIRCGANINHKAARENRHMAGQTWQG